MRHTAVFSAALDGRSEMIPYPRLQFLLVVLCVCSAGLSDDRVKMEVKIAGQPAWLALDTGSELTCLFDAGARRLGLDFRPPAPNAQAGPGQVVPGHTEECDVEIASNTMRTPLAVVTLPGYLKYETDGVIGWDFLSQGVLVFDALKKKVSMQEELPGEVSGWSCWNVRPGAKRLIVEIPSQEQNPETIMIDTGSPSGAKLAPQRWQQWVEAHRDLPATLNAFFLPGVGIIVTEERWAPVFALDGMVFHEVPVGSYGGMIQHAPADRHAATLGLRALHRMSYVVDAPNGKLYFRSHGAPEGPNQYEYNRLGAVFVPVAGKGDALVARVAEHSPAARADVRDGDVLLSIDDLDVTKWRTDPRVLPLSRFWEQPAGTSLRLGLQREGRTFEATVVLEDIFPTWLGGAAAASRTESGISNRGGVEIERVLP
jgi:hypothetical protein